MAAAKINVAFMIDKFDVGGTQRQVIALANRFAARRIGKVMMLCLQRPGPLAAELSPDIRVSSLGLTRIYGPAALWRLWRVRRMLRETGCNVIHAFLPSANIYSSLLRLLADVTVVVSRRDIGIYHSKAWQSLEERMAYRVADSVVCVSEEVRDVLLNRVPRLAGKAIVVGNAIDVSAADRLAEQSASLAPQGDYIVCVGNIKPIKAYDFLLDAASDVACRIIVIGSGAELEHLRGEVRARGLAGKLEFVGHKDPPEIAAIVRHALLAVHPSYSEGMSNAILEYMVHRKPVVCRDIPANAELVTPGENGQLFSGRADFIAHVNRLLADPALRAGMGAAARERVERQHDLDAVVGRYAELYRALGAAQQDTGRR
jgi:glycosyltransferase involved in cell wall biosynthesis